MSAHQELAQVFRQLVKNEWANIHRSLIHFFLAIAILMVLLDDMAFKIYPMVITLMPPLLALSLVFFTIIKYLAILHKRRKKES